MSEPIQFEIDALEKLEAAHLIARLVRVPRHEIISLLLTNDDDADSERADAAAERNQKPLTPEGSGRDSG